MEALNALMFQGALLSDSGRLYRLQLPGGDVQVVERWSGSEQLSGGFEWWVDVLSTQAGLPLEAWLGRRATLYTRLADGDESPRTGLIHDAYALGSDGGLARYRVGLVPWTWWLSQGRHSRVFQERTLVQIVEAVFADYAPMASWQWSEETSAFLAQARPRSYCVQYRESDLDFVQRLLAEEGLGWRLQEAAPSPGGHQLVVFADSTAQPQDPSSAQGGGLRYHRSDATEAADHTPQSNGDIPAPWFVHVHTEKPVTSTGLRALHYKDLAAVHLKTAREVNLGARWEEMMRALGNTEAKVHRATIGSKLLGQLWAAGAGGQR
ncbi:hypothetical protein FE36_05355 [Xanthomonas oryzae pv. oryzicola]|uniref:type VI secretion system Vgr family protein n=1 Tax=Xanthomonas oryzae TaxID=347 RepID=UPI0006432EBB|nr:phage late control D family protein [Xanthomonas oryzae]AKK63311.1 hypothetical protein FE36_05355 [Xanthomonas oryzae pv. oryzicola]